MPDAGFRPGTTGDVTDAPAYGSSGTAPIAKYEMIDANAISSLGSPTFEAQCLETAAAGQKLKRESVDANLFIYTRVSHTDKQPPGYRELADQSRLRRIGFTINIFDAYSWGYRHRPVCRPAGIARRHFRRYLHAPRRLNVLRRLALPNSGARKANTTGISWDLATP